MPLPFKRSDRVGDLVLRALSDLLRREVKDPRVRDVVVTAVAMSADLRQAHVRFTCGPDPARQAEALAGLASSAGFLRGRLGRGLHLRSAPELFFEVDAGVEYSLHIAALLRRVAAEEEAEGRD
ncbi:MAG: 30S ribosome-binding factor RbfA [Candidatus Methylomirabilota bacterium]